MSRWLPLDQWPVPIEEWSTDALERMRESLNREIDEMSDLSWLIRQELRSRPRPVTDDTPETLDPEASEDDN